jgi:hypothetical protein
MAWTMRAFRRPSRHVCIAFFTLQDNKLVREYIASCAVCQRNKTEHLHLVGRLQPLAVSDTVWADITRDFIDGFPSIGGKSVVLTVVDHFSKYGHFIALGHPYTASSVAKAFFDQIVRLHDLPVSIVSDKDPVFTSRVSQDLFCLSGTRLSLSSTFRL